MSDARGRSLFQKEGDIELMGFPAHPPPAIDVHRASSERLASSDSLRPQPGPPIQAAFRAKGRVLKSMYCPAGTDAVATATEPRAGHCVWGGLTLRQLAPYLVSKDQARSGPNPEARIHRRPKVGSRAGPFPAPCAPGGREVSDFVPFEPCTHPHLRPALEPRTRPSPLLCVISNTCPSFCRDFSPAPRQVMETQADEVEDYWGQCERWDRLRNQPDPSTTSQTPQAGRQLAGAVGDAPLASSWRSTIAPSLDVDQAFPCTSCFLWTASGCGR